jgi:exosortase
VNAQLDPTSTTPSGSAEPRRGQRSTRSTDWGLGGLCLLLALVAYRGLLTFRLESSSTARAAEWFFEPADTSPLLVLAFALWLLFRRRERLRKLPLAPGHPLVSALLLTAGAAGLAWAIRSQATDLQAFSLIFMALGSAHLLAGARGLRAVLLPAVFLVFSVPLPAPLLNHLVWSLQIWTAEYAGALLTLLGIPALVSGDQILLADSAFGVIETCSGLRSVGTLLMLALLMADLFRRRGLHAGLLFVAAPPIAFAINGVRAAALVLNPHSDIATVHDVQGVVMLLAGVSLLYLWDGALVRLCIGGVRSEAQPTEGAGAAAQPATLRLAGLASLLACAAALSLWLPAWPTAPLAKRSPADEIPMQLEGWRSVEHVETDWMFLGRTAYGGSLHRRYARGADQVVVFVGTWLSSRRFQSAFSPKNAFPGSGWIVEKPLTLQLDARSVDARVLRRGTRRLLTLHWYAGARGLAGESLRALLGLDASPFRRPYAPVVVRISTPFSGDPLELDAARSRLIDFARALEPGVQKLSSPRGQ